MTRGLPHRSRAGWAVPWAVLADAAVLMLVPVLLRCPAWLAGLQESPAWAAAGLMLPGRPPILPGLPGFLDFNAGWTTQALGGLAAQQWLSGQVPWWDPFAGIGMPLAAEMQSSALFLPYVLLLALPGGTTLLALALQWTAGFSAWRLLARLGCVRVAAMAGALLFQLCAAFAWMGPPSNLPVAFLPLFLLGIERARSASLQGAGGGWRMTATAVALSLYAGFPETAYLDGLLALLWAVLRLAGLPRGRPGFAARVAAGGAAGLLLAAPLLWPFLDLLKEASTGLREGISMSRLSIPLESAAQILLPYALGLPAGLSGEDATGRLVTVWGRSGGYLGMTLALAAVLGGTAPGPDRVVRGVLLGWAALFLARLFGVPGLSDLFRLVPFHDQVQIFRYSQAAWQLPCCILAACAVQHVRPGAFQARRAWAAAALLGAAGVWLGWLAWPLAGTVPGLAPYLAWSAAWAAASLLAGALAFAGARRRVVAAVLLADAALLFMVPLAAGRWRPRLDMASVRFLQENLGLHRFATLGPFQPNYGGLFGLASVNHNYLPVPSIWVRHVQAHLRPGADDALFTGNFPPDGPGRPTNAALLAEHLDGYGSLGVRYVLAPAGPSPFRPAPPRMQGAPTAFALESGAALSGTLPPQPAPVTGVAVTIGTYKGSSTGVLALTLCGPSRCATGTRSAAGAPDNQPLEITLDTAAGDTAAGDTAADAGVPLAWTLRHVAGSAVGIWRWNGPDGPAPELTVRHAPSAGSPARVHAGAVMDIYEVPGPAPYLSVTGGPCALLVQDRTRLHASCGSAATLLRRELMMPGWTVRINEVTGVPEQAGPFQAVALLAGDSQVEFRYRPPGMAAFMALFALGWLAVLPWHRMTRQRGPPR